ncbi:Coatomer subunit delta [Trichinella britovi]|uniref:Coatomer subunit delta n=1 Tax=Trichinella britovi TaxID=45882 RepID=A0A0V1CVA0_TRIBR|nr:Coatomer subunit delta [Trichinella britovi]
MVSTYSVLVFVLVFQLNDFDSYFNDSSPRFSFLLLYVLKMGNYNIFVTFIAFYECSMSYALNVQQFLVSQEWSYKCMFLLALLSRQFVEMTRSRVEGLLSAFPKLLNADKNESRQHTFIETESVRYVYQPLDQLYVFLITTKASNILEDLETLRLFARVIPEYCRSCDEKEVMERAFDLVFAFDEIVALGYRENVNLSQIRTYVDMDSHDERVYYQIKKSQEEEAKKLAKDKARELTRAKLEAGKRPRDHGMYTGFGPQISKVEPAAVKERDSDSSLMTKYSNPSKYANKPPAESGKAMKLSAKACDADAFVDQLKSEGLDFFTAEMFLNFFFINSHLIYGFFNYYSVHVKCEEKLSVAVKRDGGMENLDVHGQLSFVIFLILFNEYKRKIVFGVVQTHPNLDKKAFASNGLLTLKNVGKPFPVNTEVSVLKWRFQSQDEAYLPFSLNCWPSESADGCEVNIEYTLEDENMQLEDVLITIPLPSGSPAPVIVECDGEYKHVRMHNCLEWRLPLIDYTNKQGCLEFTTKMGHVDHFFPIKIQFSSKQLFCNITAEQVSLADDNNPVKFSQEIKLITEKYIVV